ncbi:MAG: Ni/Fe hydrogenase subunit alpha [Thermoprotei archaeon]|nr:MAG: Ni/Fe hydrogenase subunit alpha [Thermoprotei archaeon]
MRVVEINPVTRLEGEARIIILLDDNGKVKDAYFQVLEFKGFERFCIGRPAEEMPRIVTRICGVCPWAHHMASGKAVDAVFGREPTPIAKKIRELAYCAHILDSHSVHFYFLAAPDFLTSPDASRAERNAIYLYKVAPDLVREIIEARRGITKIETLIGGKSIHPVCCLPGGVSKGLNEDERKEIEEIAKNLIRFSEKWLDLWDQEILSKYEDIILGDTYTLETYYMGLVGENNTLNFYDGDIRVVDQMGKEVYRFKPDEYLNYVVERVEPWSYTKFPYLKPIGWKGLVDGPKSGIYRVGPLARLNVIDKISTEKAQEAYEKFVEIGGKPAHATMMYHWSRLIEMLYASELIVELVQEEDITSNDLVNYSGELQRKGVGVVEAPRGILFHHYETDENALITMANLIIPTTQNNPSICMDIKKSASKLITNGNISEGILNRVEMAFRAYDPCLACSTHALPGRLPIRILVLSSDGQLIKEITR